LPGKAAGLHPSSIYEVYASELIELSAAWEVVPSMAHRDSVYRARTIAAVLCALQLAVAARYAGIDGGLGPFSSTNSLRAAASSVPIPPDLRAHPISRNVFETAMEQPVLTADGLGLLLRAQVRALGQSVALGMVPSTAIVNIARTIERLPYARRKALGNTERDSTTLAFAGLGTVNGGTGMILGTHPQVQAESDLPSELWSSHLARGLVETDPVRLRLRMMGAIREQLVETSGRDVAVILRGERRFAPPAEGSATDPRNWFVTDQPGWHESTRLLGLDAVALFELAVEVLGESTYGFDSNSYSLPASTFLRKAELRDAGLGFWDLRMSRASDEHWLHSPDDVVVGDLPLRFPGHDALGGRSFTPLIVLSEGVTCVYLIDRDRALRFTSAQWDAVRAGLAAIHGEAWQRSSDDQGLALSETVSRALSIHSTNINKACSYDALRSLSHAVETRSHWQDEPPPEPPARLREAA
jgi:hypothetical protein